jgi:hypothetical protein
LELLKPLQQLYGVNKVQITQDEVTESTPAPEFIDSRTSGL